VPNGVTHPSAELFSFIQEQLRPGEPPNQQLLAARVIEKARLSGEQLSSLAQTIKHAGPLEIGPILAAFAQTKDPAIGQQLAAALKDARSLTSLRAESVRAALTPFGDEV